MAKEEIHNWMRTAILLFGIVFAGGGYAMKINDNSVRVQKVETSVHDLELNQQRDIALKENTLAALVRLETKLDNVSAEITPIKTDMAVLATKVNTLTKD